MKRRTALGCVVALVVLTAPVALFGADEPFKIAVLANRGAEEALRRWQPTAEYLNSKIPGTTFSIVPLDFDEIFVGVERGHVDFVIANSGIYVAMEVLHGVARIATLKNLRNGVVCKYFGGVIFTLASRQDIQTLADVKGKSFMAVDDRSLGGCLMAWRELLQQGVDPRLECRPLSFGGTHDAVMHAVREGQVDVGTVRTDLFERIVAEGRMDIAQFRILNPQPKTTDFPFVRSTRLYPEWPIAKCRHTHDDTAQKVAIALMELPQDSPAARAAECAGWTVPLEYSSVHECLKELRVHPYQHDGRITFRAVFKAYWHWILLTVLGVAVLTFAILKLRRLNQRLTRTRADLEQELVVRKRTEAELQAVHVGLEARVAERTSELAAANTVLKNEIVEHHHATAELRTSQERFNQLAENIHQAFWITTPNKSETIYVSPAFERVFGCSREEFYKDSSSLLKHVHPDDRTVLIAALPQQAQGEWEHEYRFIRPDGAVRWMREIAFPVRNPAGEVFRVAGLTEDITERKSLEQQFLQAQRMDAIGQLSGGIAHDFNNLLTAISSCCDLLRASVQDKEKPRSYLEIIQTAVQRGASLTRQLLTFSRRQVLTPQVLDLNTVVHGMTDMLRRVIGDDIRLDLELCTSPCRVNADTGQMEQVLMNLCVNARDAMPQGGRLSITTLGKVTHISQGNAAQVALRVTDTGSGMDAATQARVFEPFFTTKEVGKGTGLGLSTVYGIVRQCGGSIILESKPGCGASFTIFLPEETNEVEVGRAVQPPETHGGQATVLVAEDDPVVRETVCALLSQGGYNVLPTCSGEEALELFVKNENEIDLIITDMVMPGMSGWVLSERIRARKKTTPILFMSGYTPDETVRQTIQEPGLAYLQKPFTLAQLQQKLAALLENHKRVP